MQRRYEGKGTFWSSVFTLANSAIGAGVLAFPYAFGETGLLLGISLTLAFGVVMSFTAHVLARSTEHAQRMAPDRDIRSYQDVAQVLVGPRLETMVVITLSVFLFGACVGLLVVVGDMAEPLLVSHFPSATVSRRSIISAVAVVIVLPLSMLPRVSMLGFTSFLALLSVLYIMLCIAVESITQPGAASALSATNVLRKKRW